MALDTTPLTTTIRRATGALEDLQVAIANEQSHLHRRAELPGTREADGDREMRLAHARSEQYHQIAALASLIGVFSSAKILAEAYAAAVAAEIAEASR